jgi:addiction module RelE/StbE family toxin
VVKALRVRVLRRAQTDLAEIAAYLRKEAPDVAGRIVDELLDAMEGLGAAPRSSALARDERLRGLGFRVHLVRPYLVFYKVTAGDVRIYLVLHERREYRRLI